MRVRALPYHGSDGGPPDLCFWLWAGAFGGQASWLLRVRCCKKTRRECHMPGALILAPMAARLRARDASAVSDALDDTQLLLVRGSEPTIRYSCITYYRPYKPEAKAENTFGTSVLLIALGLMT